MKKEKKNMVDGKKRYEKQKQKPAPGNEALKHSRPLPLRPLANPITNSSNYHRAVKKVFNATAKQHCTVGFIKVR